MEAALTEIADGLLITKSEALYSIFLLLGHAAFGTVDHSLLLKSVHDLGLPCSLLTQFSPYLFNCV